MLMEQYLETISLYSWTEVPLSCQAYPQLQNMSSLELIYKYFLGTLCYVMGSMTSVGLPIHSSSLLLSAYRQVLPKK